MYSIVTIGHMLQMEFRHNFIHSQVSSKISYITLIRPRAHEYWASRIAAELSFLTILQLMTHCTVGSMAVNPRCLDNTLLPIAYKIPIDEHCHVGWCHGRDGSGPSSSWDLQDLPSNIGVRWIRRSGVTATAASMASGEVEESVPLLPISRVDWLGGD